MVLPFEESGIILCWSSELFRRMMGSLVVGSMGSAGSLGRTRSYDIEVLEKLGRVNIEVKRICFVDVVDYVKCQRAIHFVMQEQGALCRINSSHSSWH